MKKVSKGKQGGLILTSALIGAAAGALATLGGYVRHEIRRRGYPSWEHCDCDFKTRQTIFQVWYSRHEQRGETVLAQEWGLQLTNPPVWLRYLLHSGSQVMATLNPGGRYVERVVLSPQEARQPVYLLGTPSSVDETSEQSTHYVWRREILQTPQHFLGKYTQRLYPAHISEDLLSVARPLQALWNPQSNLPLPNGGTILNAPVGTRIDWIGWTPSQISYCTARVEPPESNE